ncbi:hypothetical protein GCM10010336_16770 [Streptomyces goshikiensis]|nr:hypothetical protein GCM10010336_16770 [Streptomyces goshikiensis]
MKASVYAAVEASVERVVSVNVNPWEKGAPADGADRCDQARPGARKTVGTYRSSPCVTATTATVINPPLLSIRTHGRVTRA